MLSRAEQLKQNAKKYIKIKYCRKIQIVRIFFLDQCTSKTTINKYLQNVNKDQNQCNYAKNLRIQFPGNNKRNYQRDPLRTKTFRKAPNKIAKNFLLPQINLCHGAHFAIFIFIFKKRTFVLLVLINTSFQTRPLL